MRQIILSTILKGEKVRVDLIKTKNFCYPNDTVKSLKDKSQNERMYLHIT